MQATITESAARELGRSLRFIRQARALTLRDVSRGSGMSPQYLAQVELAQKLGASEEALLRLAKPLGVPEAVIADLIMRARIQSALENRGLDRDQVAFVWRGIEARLAEVGFDLRTDISKVVVDILT